MSNYTDLLIRLEKAQRDYPDTHVLLGQTRTAIGKLREAICIYMRDEHEHHEDEITNDDEAIERFLLDYLEPTTEKGE
jgi:hypothetical protein